MISHARSTTIATTFLLALTAHSPRAFSESPTSNPPWIATGKTMMVATDHPQASQVGLDVLRAGGNAIDAAVAVSFALGVTRPQSTGLGGGGFLIARMADTKDIHVFDYREVAPQKANNGLFEHVAKFDETAPPPSRYGYLAAGVPGLLAGMSAVHERFGTVPMSKLIQPSIKLAEDGVPVDQHYVDATESIARIYEQYPQLKATCSYVYRVHLQSGQPRRVGETLKQPALAKLLRLIASDGKDAFYKGPVATAMGFAVHARKGIIMMRDLNEYRVKTRKPLVSSYRGYELVTMPPPSSGGVCLIETLNMLEGMDLKSIRQRDPGLAMHYQTEAMKRAFADRATWLADADFVEVPVDRLTSKAYAKTLAAQIKDSATPVQATEDNKQLPNDSGTSHYCIVDRWGNIVIATETINTSFGSLAAIDAYGLILNNQMDDFAAERGKPNAYDLLQSDRNAVEPGKRPLSSMTPTLVLRDGHPVLALGGSGGPRIISSVLNVILNVLDYEMPLADAVRATRLHHQWMPDRVVSDRSLDPKIYESFTARGHSFAENHATGIVQAIQWTQDGLVGASDPRKHGLPRGE